MRLSTCKARSHSHSFPRSPIRKRYTHIRSIKDWHSGICVYEAVSISSLYSSSTHNSNKNELYLYLYYLCICHMACEIIVYFACSSARLRRLFSNGLFELSSAFMCIWNRSMSSFNYMACCGNGIYWKLRGKWRQTWPSPKHILDHSRRALLPMNVSFLPAPLAKSLHLRATHGPYAMAFVAQLYIAIDLNWIDPKNGFEFELFCGNYLNLTHAVCVPAFADG